MRRNKLNQRGFDHVMVLVAFVALFGLAGVSFVYFSKAATPINELESAMTINGVHYCLDDHGDGGAGSHVDAWQCNGSAAQKFSFSNGLLYIGKSCAGVSGAGSRSIGRYLVIESSCNPAPWGGVFTASGPYFLNNHADTQNPYYNTNHTFYCLDVAGAKADAWVDVWPCTGAANQRWSQETFTPSSTTPTSGTTTTSNPYCTLSTYKLGVTAAPCVGYIQALLNFEDGAGLTVNNQFNSQTQAAVITRQKLPWSDSTNGLSIPAITADGQVGPATWDKICTIAKESFAASATSSYNGVSVKNAYNNSGCLTEPVD